MTPSLEGWPTNAKEAPSPHEVRLAPLDTNPVFQSLGGKISEEDKISVIESDICVDIRRISVGCLGDYYGKSQSKYILIELLKFETSTI